jgi:hypothetical protein
MVGGLGEAAEKLDNLLPRGLPPAPLIQGEDDSAFLLR